MGDGLKSQKLDSFFKPVIKPNALPVPVVKDKAKIGLGLGTLPLPVENDEAVALSTCLQSSSTPDSVSTNHTNGNKKKVYFQTFRSEYTKAFSFFVASRKGEKHGFCNICRCDISISHGGRNDLVAHTKSKKHIEFVDGESCNRKLPITGFFAKNTDHSVIRAECLFTRSIVEHNLPIALADHAGPLFRKMFPDSEIAKKYGCARTKTTAIIGEMANTSKQGLVDLLKTKPYSIATDGSNDDNSQLYPIVATVFDDKTSCVESYLLAVPNLEGACTGLNIGNMLLSTLNGLEIPITNCIAMGADNAPVMIGKKSGVASVLTEANPNIFIVGCPCHLINLAAQKAAACLPVNVDEILIDIFYYLDKSSKRKQSFAKFQKLHDAEQHKFLKHICTRWLSVGKCLGRMMEQWDPLTSFFHDEVKKDGPKSQATSSLSTFRIPKTINSCSSSKPLPTTPTIQPTCVTNKRKCDSPAVLEPGSKKEKSDKPKPGPSTSNFTGNNSTVKQSPLSRPERIFLFLTSKVSQAYSRFILYIIPIFETANTTLQYKTPYIHKLQRILTDMLRDILSKFVKPTVLKEAKHIWEVEYHEKTNQLGDADVMIGNATEKIVAVLTTTEKKLFYTSVRSYFKASCDYIIHKFPLKDSLLKNAEVASIGIIEYASFSSIKFF